MAGILHNFVRSLPRGARKIVNNSFERISSFESESITARGYRANAATVYPINIYFTSLQKFYSESQRKSLPFVKRNIQSTSALGTSKDVVVPAFADSISEGDVQFLKNVGDSVVEDDIVCEIETDKTSVEVPTPGKGVIEEFYVENGSVVKPGMKLFRIKLEGNN